MRVKSAELKAKLALYLRRLRESGEPIEVLLRDEPVAYLIPIEQGSARMAPGAAAEFQKLKSAFTGVGLTLAFEDVHVGALPKLAPVPAGDGRTEVATVPSIRAEKDW